MMKLTILSVLVAVCAASRIKRVVNGTNAAPGEIPSIVSLRWNNSHSCGASILNATHVLTAASCVAGRESNTSSISIQYGLLKITNDNTNVILATKVVSHPEYSSWDNVKNDVAVITLASAIPIWGDIRETYLPSQDDPILRDQAAVLAGWGLPYSEGSVMQDLQRVDIKVYTIDCENAYGSDINRDYELCAGVLEGGKGQCIGDSGGPLTVDGIQVGIATRYVKPCAIKDNPGIFTKVSRYVNWIRRQMT